MADAWEFADQVDILSKLPENFEEMVSSKKWNERKEALEGLLFLATNNIRLDPAANYKPVVDVLIKVLTKDSNINVCAVAAKSITQLAKGLRTEFGPFVKAVAAVLFEKFKEKKPILRDPLVDAIDAVYASSNLEVLCEEIVAALGKQNPDIKKQTNLFLCRTFKTFDGQAPPMKAVKALTPAVVKCTADPDAETREAAFSVLGAMMNAAGKVNVMALLFEISNDKTKMAQVERFYNQAQSEVAESRNSEVKLDEGQGDAASSEELIKMKNLNNKLIAEKNEMKTKLDKARAEIKKLSHDLSAAQQKCTESEASKEEFLQMKARIMKLTAENADFKRKLNKASLENKKTSQELSEALQKISKMESASVLPKPRTALSKMDGTPVRPRPQTAVRSSSVMKAQAAGSRIPAVSSRQSTPRIAAATSRQSTPRWR